MAGHRLGGSSRDDSTGLDAQARAALPCARELLLLP